MVTVVSTHSQLAGEEQPHWVVRREEVEMTTEELGRGGWGSGERGQASRAQGLIQMIVSSILAISLKLLGTERKRIISHRCC